MNQRILPWMMSVVLMACSAESEKTSDVNDRSDSDKDVKEVAMNEDGTNSLVRLPANLKSESISNSSDHELRFETGTRLTIPKNAFVHKDGSPVSGDVDLQFEEYHSAGDIIASGIPMTYDSAGTQYDFESAGMFEIRALQDGEELALAEGKEIGVELASYKAGNDFTFYYTPDRQSEWEYEGVGGQLPNLERDNRLMEISDSMDQPEPQMPLAYDPSGNYFDLNIDYDQFHTYKSLMGILWQYAGDDPDEDPYNHPKVYKRVWQHVSIVPDSSGGVYKITLSNEDTVVRTAAQPVYRGKVLTEASEEFNAKLQAFNDQMNRLQLERERRVRESKLLRTFNINKMGIYNYDRQYKYENMIPLMADFEVGGESLKGEHISVYLITAEGTAVVSYPEYDWEKFRFNPNDKNVLVAIMPDNTVVTYDSGKFRRLGRKGFNRQEAQPYTFSMDLTQHKATSADALNEVIKTL